MNQLSIRRIFADPFFVLALVLLFGYLTLSRNFAYLGIRPLYISEAALAAFLIAKPSSLLWPWLNSLSMPSRLTGFGWWLAISLVLGVTQLAHVFLQGTFSIRAAENFVFYIYPLYLFPGVWVGVRHPHLLPRLMYVLGWCHGLYGLAYIFIFDPLGLAQGAEFPSIGWVGHPVGTPIVLLGLFAFERNLRRAAIPLLMNTFIMLAMQRRAEWLAFMVAIVLWACLAGHAKRLLAFGGVLLCVLVVGLIPGVRFPTPGMRGESTSTMDLVGRALSAVDPSMAEGLTNKADDYGATASWRTDFWSGIWQQVHATPSRAVFGLGFDYPVWQLHPLDLDHDPVRTPHSIIMFVLGYSGWLGILIFVGLQWAIGQMLWRTYRETGQPFGISLWALVIAWAVFDPLLEVPFHAIPIYLLLGIAAVPSYAPRPTGGLGERGRT